MDASSHTTGVPVDRRLTALAAIRVLLLEAVRAEAQYQCAHAMVEASVEQRPVCIFGHPLFPNSRFVLNAGGPVRIMR